MPHRIPFAHRPVRAAVTAGLLSVLLAGCAAQTAEVNNFGIETGDISGARSIDPAYAVPVEDSAQTRASDGPMAKYIERAAEVAIEDKQIYGAVVHLSKLYEDDPRNQSVAYDYARHLRYVGALDEAERVLADARALHGEQALLRLETAKLRVAAGRADEALSLLEPLLADQPDDPSILQTKGVALDRMGRHEEAREVYRHAMESGRPTAALLNNAAMSHLLSGAPAEAETLLRQAAAAPGATAQVQQNLALALTLQGKLDEARRVAEAAAPKAVVEPSLEYYQTIAAVSHAWSVAGGGRSEPVSAPAAE